MPTSREYARWGRRGARALNAALSAAERSESARRAVVARWKRTPKAARTDAARLAVRVRWTGYRARQKDRER